VSERPDPRDRFKWATAPASRRRRRSPRRDRCPREPSVADTGLERASMIFPTRPDGRSGRRVRASRPKARALVAVRARRPHVRPITPLAPLASWSARRRRVDHHGLVSNDAILGERGTGSLGASAPDDRERQGERRGQRRRPRQRPALRQSELAVDYVQMRQLDEESAFSTPQWRPTSARCL